jgi:outer membrane protein assembly factor BamB
VEPLAAGDPRQVGGYRLRARLGAGGMGQVFLGYSPAGRAVAVKVIRRELALDPEFRTRFRREVAAARAVSGAYTAPVTAAGPDDDPPWLATVFVPGPSLAEAVAVAGPLPPVSAWKLAAGLVEALQAIHSCGLVHRDLKPANVLLALDGPRVIDFGISRAAENTAMTSTGMLVGTPSFMSPEQAQDARVGPASDVFSLGGVIVFAATGKGPFGSGPQATMLYRVVHAPPTLDEVPGGLRELAAACLAKEPADRPDLAALVAATAAGRAPDEDDALTSFWPVPVTGLIRSHQARLAAEMRDRTAPPSTAAAPAGQVQQPRGLAASAVATAPATALAGTAVQETTGPEATQPEAAGGETGGYGPTQPGPVAGAQDGVPPTPSGGRPTVAVVPAAFPARADDGPAGARAATPEPAMPADFVAGDAPARRAVRGVTRRRMLAGLAVIAGAGLAGAGYELSQEGSPQHPASAVHHGPATGPSRPAPRPSTGARPAGAALWSFPTGGMVAGIALAHGTVFAGSTDGRVYALRASDGRRLWAFPTGGPVQSAIAAAGGAVYAGSDDGSVYALRASDGRRLWAFPTGDPVQSVITVAGDAVYASSENETLYALSASDGTRLWSVFTCGGAGGIAVSDGAVHAGGAGGRVYALRASNGTRLWDSPTGAGAIGIAAAGGTVYAGSDDGRVYALRASNGTRLWDTPTGGPVQSGIAVAGGAVYAGSEDDKVLALRASNGRQLWHVTTAGPVSSGIAVVGGIVYAGGNDYTVRALRASNGRQLWSFAAAGPVASQIVVAGGVAYLGSNDGKVYALKGQPA